MCYREVVEVNKFPAMKANANGQVHVFYSCPWFPSFRSVHCRYSPYTRGSCSYIIPFAITYLISLFVLYMLCSFPWDGNHFCFYTMWRLLTFNIYITNWKLTYTLVFYWMLSNLFRKSIKYAWRLNYTIKTEESMSSKPWFLFHLEMVVEGHLLHPRH